MANSPILVVGSAGALVAAAATVATTNPLTVPAATPPINAAMSAPAPVTDGDAARLAKQATFGPTPAVIARIKKLGINGWLDEQFSLKSSSYADLISIIMPKSYCDLAGRNVPNCFRIYRDSLLPAMRFYRNAITEDDQLRQRVAFALFNIMPVSGLKIASSSGLSRYEQLLHDNAFNNYADVLRAVLMSSAMAGFLDMADSPKSAPNENVAREMMQLFSTGPNVLNADGTPRRDPTGALMPNYTTKDITEAARALTGWTYARLNNGALTNGDLVDWSKPLVPNPATFDSGAKTFLGITIPAGATQAANIDAIVKRLTEDPSTAPRISRLLIQSLVKSNPSAAYVGRVAGKFRNNGTGVVGDMRAVIRAVLTDPEARTRDTSASGGKLKDPILLMTGLARAVPMVTDGYAFTVRDVQMGQQYLRGPSIFGDYPPDYPLSVNNKLVSPASKLMTVATIHERHNFVWQWTMSGDSARGEYVTPTWLPKASKSLEDWSSWEQFGTNVDGMIDRISLLMLDNAITPEQRTALKAAMMLVTDPSPSLQSRRRAQTGLFIVASSPQFQIDR